MSNEKRIPISKPSITKLEIEYVTDAITNGWGQHCYDYIHKLGNLFSKYLGVKYALPTSSGTGAIHLALAALGIGKGDEVIVPELTWVATAAPVVWLGATPIFADVLKDSWCVDPKSIESKITSKTKAIFAVHLYGNMCEMDEIIDIGKRYGIPVLEDAAQALGSVYKQKKAGSMGLVNVFSFHGTKTMTTGEGGIVVTDNAEVFEKICVLNDHGRNPKVSTKMFWMDKIGYKYKISNLAAALGCAQIERIDDLVNRKREIFSWYKKLLSKYKDISLNIEPEYVFNSFWMPNIMFDRKLNVNMEVLLKNMKEANIDIRTFFYPLSSMPMFQKEESNKIAYDLFDRGLNLPTNFDLTLEDAERVVRVIDETLKKS
jgi:perosamine synthetase